jgi:preprotein translocase subunit YajC
MSAGWTLLIFAVLFVGMIYLLMIRPIQQREKQHDRMVEELQIGDSVITAGGMYGKVDSIAEDSIVITVESGAKIRMTKGGVIKRQDET